MRSSIFLLTLVLTFSMFYAADLSADGVNRSVAIVLDLSYSMRLADAFGVSRLKIMKSALGELLARADQGVEWACIAFDDSESVTLLQPFTQDSSRLVAVVNAAESGRLSPIGAALSFAADYMHSNARSTHRAIVLVSDGISTEQQNVQFTLGPAFRKYEIPLFILGCDHTKNPGLIEPLNQIAAYTGGAYIKHGDVERLKSILLADRDGPIADAGPAEEPAVGIDEPVGVTRGSATTVRTRPESGAGGLSSQQRNSVLATAGEAGSTSGKGKPEDAIDSTRSGHALLFLAAAGGFLFLLSVFFARRARQRRQSMAMRQPQGRVFLNLSVRYPGGEVRQFRLEHSPANVGNAPQCQVYLETEKSRGKVVFVYTWDAREAAFSSARAFLLNGVAVRKKSLRVGDRLIFDRYRLVFDGLETETVGTAAPKNYSLVPLAAGCFLVVLAVLLWGISRFRMPASSDPHRQRAPGIAAGQMSRQAADLASNPAPARAARTLPDRRPLFAEARAASRENSPGADPDEKSQTGSSPSGASTAAMGGIPLASPSMGSADAAPGSGRAREQMLIKQGRRTFYLEYALPKLRQILPLRQRPIRMVAPGEDIEADKVDMLFVHSHPDDESLDFGGAMAKAVSSGKRIATVLFTDGESGLDQFPYRGIDGTHPAHYLRGDRLALVRVEEAASAMAFLGSSLYIRLGLRNHLYNSSEDVLPVETVMSYWGGEDWLMGRLIEIIEALRPDVVISSDFNPRAYEHFEHKATGYITRQALAELRSKGQNLVKGYLVSVDHFQEESLYPELELVDLMEVDPATGLTYREIQRAALAEHRTQGDASLIGVELLPNFKWEQYSAVFWDFDVSLDDYIKHFAH